ncbi:MAG: archease [Thermodesulfobacteriota bacterium]|nr:archease [Thermodesulfobacteriota bacterium]
MKRYETFDHTADLGIRIFGRTCEEVFANAAYALFDLLTGLDQVRENIAYTIQVEAEDREELLIRFLSELLFLCESEGYLFQRFSFTHLNQKSLKVVAYGETFDPSRHEFKTEIKAVTYHQVEVKESHGAWEGRVIFDL